MNCQQFERQLQHLLDERAENSLCADRLPKPMRNHAADCTDCTELLDGYRTLFTVLASERPEPAVFQATDVVRLSSPVGRRYRWLRTAVPLATAATLLLAAFMVYEDGTPGTAQSAAPVLSDSTSPAPTLDDEVIAVTAFGPISSRVFFGAPLEINERSVGFVLNLAGLSPVTMSAELLDSPLVDKSGWMMQVSDGLRPMAERMTGTLNALLQGFPESGAPQDPSQGARNDRYSHYGQLS